MEKRCAIGISEALQRALLTLTRGLPFKIEQKIFCTMKNLDGSVPRHLEKFFASARAAARQCRWHDKNFTRVIKKILSQIQNVALSSAFARNAKTTMAQR